MGNGWRIDFTSSPIVKSIGLESSKHETSKHDRMASTTSIPKISLAKIYLVNVERGLYYCILNII